MTSRSERRRRGGLTLAGDLPGTRFSILDAAGRPAATASDSDAVDLPPGVYEIVAERAGVSEHRLVRVRTDGGAPARFDLPIHGAPIVAGTSEYDPATADAVTQASAALQHASGGTAGYLLAPTAPRDGTRRRPQCTLLHANGRPVAWGGHASRDGYATYWGRTRPGAYVLRTAWRDESGTLVTVEQTLWLAAGRQTIVSLPNDERGVHAAAASVHVTPIGTTWDGTQRSHLLAELALAELRAAQPVLTAGLVEAVRTPETAMAALYAAQIALTDGSNAVVADVLHALEEALPAHPDVRALRVFLGDHDGEDAAAARCAPMFAGSYWTALIPADLHDPDVIPAHTQAEEVAATALAGGPWLQWQAPRKPLQRVRDAAERLPLPLPSLPTTTILARLPIGGSGVGAALPDIVFRRMGRVVARTTRTRPKPSPAAVRVDSYVATIARRRGTSPAAAAAELGTRELAQRLAMPTSLVDRSLSELGYEA